MPEPSSREEAIFKAVVELTTAQERAALLERECGGDATLRASVESLLRASDVAGSFLSEPIGLTQIDEGLGKTVLEVPRREGGTATVSLSAESYAVGGEIASGGMGSILEAEDRKLGRKVAMKVMLLEATASDEARSRFVREATVLARLEHPNIVPIHELGCDSEDRPFYTMKLVHGRTLQAVIEGVKQGDPDFVRYYTLDRVLTIFRKICDALALAHSRGVIHRDLKPQNIMVGEFGEVLVMDWGLAKILGDAQQAAEESRFASKPEFMRGVAAAPVDAGLTMEGTVMGTPHYMSPEQASGRVADIDQQSDVFSLGAILYALLALRPPVEADSLEGVLEKIRRGDIRPPTEFNPATGGKGQSLASAPVHPTKYQPLPHCPGGRVPAALSSVAMKALAVDKARRYGGVVEFGADIEKFQAGFATSAEQAGLAKQIVLLIKRHKTVFSTAAAAWLIITALAAWFVVKIAASEHKATRERDRAENTLAQLRGTAPTFVAQARALVDQGKLEDALAKIGYAIELDPQNAAYLLQRANLLEAAARLNDAVDAYHQVLAVESANASARNNLALCERLLRENGPAPGLRRDLQQQLLDALLHEDRAIEAGQLALLLGKDSAAIEGALRARLKEYKAQPGWWETRLMKLSNGTFKLDLQKLKLGDLSILEGMPVSQLVLSETDFADLTLLPRIPLTLLNISHTQVTDLSPLRGQKLETLLASGCRISDLEPLRGMPMQSFSVIDCEVADLSPLTGMPLQDLNLQNTNPQSLEPLRGAPLRRLVLSKARGIVDLAPLATCRDLEEIVIPNNAANVLSLRGLPKLARISMEGYEDTLVSAEKFWAEFKPVWEALGDGRIAARKVGIVFDNRNWVNRLPDGTLEAGLYGAPIDDLAFVKELPISHLNAGNTKVHDLTPLRGLPLTELQLRFAPVTDLDPLRGLPLTVLNLASTAVTDLEPLRGMPLEKLNLLNSRVTSIAPLKDCPNLQSLVVPKWVRDVDLLRNHPKLEMLSYQQGPGSSFATKTAEEFWKEFDKPKGKKPKPAQ